MLWSAPIPTTSALKYKPRQVALVVIVNKLFNGLQHRDTSLSLIFNRALLDIGIGYIDKILVSIGVINIFWDLTTQVLVFRIRGMADAVCRVSVALQNVDLTHNRAVNTRLHPPTLRFD